MSVMLLSSCISISDGEDLKKIVPLSGFWKFSIGDDISWADPEYNDDDWDEIHVPDKWEDQGYSDYNGYAWYRKEFRINEFSANESVYLIFGRIDDCDEVYLNGKLLAGSGKFPPHLNSAWDARRKYLIPTELLYFNAVNTLSIRVYDSYLEGGIVAGPVGIYADENEMYIDYDLSGNWRFHTGDNKEWKKPEFNDDSWDEIRVPEVWESQGYEDYDGYAWYRKQFTVPSELQNKNLYLSLGKVDDYDIVYLNGEPIGSVFNLKKDGEYSRKGNEYRARRVYEIPSGLLKYQEVNILSVRVYDGQMRGGIYEGPVGLMTDKNMKAYKRKNYSNRQIWDFIIDEFLTD